MAGLSVLSVDIEPLALLRALGPTTPGRRVLLILGERATAVVLAEGQQLLFVKYYPTGTQHLDQAVARHLLLAPPVATQTRALVTSSSAIDPYNDVHRAVMDAIQSPMDALCAEIELCLRYFQVTFRGVPLESVVVAGLDATGWMADYLQRRLGLVTSVADPFTPWGPVPEAVQEQPASWAVACGLSLKRRDAANQRPAPLLSPAHA
jgi:Tfp pilus assembly PilM family ATPase